MSVTSIRSFAYASSSITNGMAYFGSDYRMGPGFVQPGAGNLPTDTEWYVRKIGLTYLGGSANTDWAIVGHSGPNGDWCTPACPAGQYVEVDFPADAPVQFENGEYFDVHVTGGGQILVVFFWEPIPAP